MEEGSSTYLCEQSGINMLHRYGDEMCLTNKNLFHEKEFLGMLHGITGVTHSGNDKGKSGRQFDLNSNTNTA